jgi:hypothetical protein
MFEAAREQKQSGTNKMMVGILVLVGAMAVGAVLYTMSKNAGPASAPKTAAAAAVPAGKADAEHDLKILSSRMEKDRLGTTAVWLVDIDNKSKTYTYSRIQYETTYVGANNAALVVNKGTIAAQLGPGEERNAQIRDVLYPEGTAWYKFRIIGATPSVQ